MRILAKGESIFFVMDIFVNIAMWEINCLSNLPIFLYFFVFFHSFFSENMAIGRMEISQIVICSCMYVWTYSDYSYTGQYVKYMYVHTYTRSLFNHLMNMKKRFFKWSLLFFFFWFIFLCVNFYVKIWENLCLSVAFVFVVVAVYFQGKYICMFKSK